MSKSKIRQLPLMLLLCLTLSAVLAHAGFETDVRDTIKIDNAPLAVEISRSGQLLFVLDDQGQLLVYNIAGGLLHKVQVGTQVDQIKVGPNDDLLLLSSKQARTVQLLNLAFTHDIDLTGSPFKGPKNAPVAIVVFSDFQCPYCSKVGPVIDQVREQFPKEVKSAFKHFPLPNHSFSTKAAQATIAADAQGKFWEMHDLIFANFSMLSDEKIQEFVTTLGLNKAKFDKIVQAPETMAKINKDKQEGDQAGVRGTPTIFVNGRVVRPANFEGIKAAVEKALKDVKKK